jgi:hypothetical protein
VKRDAAKAAGHPDPDRIAAGLPVGPDGAYYVGALWDDEDHAAGSVLNYNTPPEGQPDLWCKWAASADGTAVLWSGDEQFYDYVAWLEYLIDHFLGPWGYRLDGAVTWQGERASDLGKIVVTDNEVTTKQGRIVYE